MPNYCYKCTNCEEEFEVRHSMSFEGQTCVKCNSDLVFRIPSLSLASKAKSTKKVGKIVDDYIQEAKSEIKSEKKALKLREI